ncbi:MAG: Panacea domain-containing protein [Sandarakinorhabdus sp.]
MSNYDPRDLANLVLQVAAEVGATTSNLAMNKIVYFVHGSYLARFGEPLVDATIEAWQFGPVFRELYHSFKQFGDGPIRQMAARIDPTDGRKKAFVAELPNDRQQVVEQLIKNYLSIKPAMLVNMSHVEDGPWYDAWNYQGTVNPGMSISNEAIQQYFASQKRH